MSFYEFTSDLSEERNIDLQIKKQVILSYRKGNKEKQRLLGN